MLVTSKNGVDVERQEKSYSGTDGDYVSDTRTYVKHGECWFLTKRMNSYELELERESAEYRLGGTGLLWTARLSSGRYGSKSLA